MSMHLREDLECFQSDGWPHPKQKNHVHLTTNPRGNRTCHTCGRKITSWENSFTCFCCLDELVVKVSLNQSLFGDEEEEEEGVSIIQKS